MGSLLLLALGTVLTLAFSLIALWHTQHARARKRDRGIVLCLRVARDNERGPSPMQEALTALHALGLTYGLGDLLRARPRPRLSLEIALIEGTMHLMIWTPTCYRAQVEAQLYAQYPALQLSPVKDYARAAGMKPKNLARFSLHRDELYPIKRHAQFGQELESLAALTSSLGSLTRDTHVWIQLVISPASHRWVRRAQRRLSKVTQAPDKASSAAPLDLQAARQKLGQRVYRSNLRLVWASSKEARFVEVSKELELLSAGLESFRLPHSNHLVARRVRLPSRYIAQRYAERQLRRPLHLGDSPDFAQRRDAFLEQWALGGTLALRVRDLVLARLDLASHEHAPALLAAADQAPGPAYGLPPTPSPTARTTAPGPDLPSKLNAQQAACVEDHLMLVKRTARRVSRSVGDALLACDELEAVGYQALVETALRYDPNHTRSASFATFASYRVQGAMIDALRKLSPGRRRRARANHPGERGAHLTERLWNCETRTGRSISDREAAPLDDQLARQQFRVRAWRLVQALHPSERELIDALYVQDQSMTEFARHVGVNVGTISRRHARVLKRLGAQIKRFTTRPIPPVSNL